MRHVNFSAPFLPSLYIRNYKYQGMSIERADCSLPYEKSSAEKDSGPHVYQGEAIVYPNDGSENVIPREEETHRALSPRQLSMIALGGAIGE